LFLEFNIKAYEAILVLYIYQFLYLFLRPFFLMIGFNSIFFQLLQSIFFAHFTLLIFLIKMIFLSNIFVMDLMTLLLSK